MGDTRTPQGSLETTARFLEALRHKHAYVDADADADDDREPSASARSVSGNSVLSKTSKASRTWTAHSMRPKPTLSPFQRLDATLAAYYAQFAHRNVTYVDEQGKGRFLAYVERHGFDESEMAEELGDDVAAADSMYVEMDRAFPLFAALDCRDALRRKEAVLAVIRFCHRHGRAPNSPAALQRDASAKGSPHGHGREHRLIAVCKRLCL